MTSDKQVTILVIHDDPKFLETLVQILEIDDYKSSGITGSDDLLNRIRETSLDLIICDMSVLDGISFIRQLRNDTDPRLSKLPVIFLTDSNPMGDVIKEWDSGLDDYIIKPVAIVELQERIQGILRSRERLLTNPKLS